MQFLHANKTSVQNVCSRRAVLLSECLRQFDLTSEGRRRVTAQSFRRLTIHYVRCVLVRCVTMKHGLFCEKLTGPDGIFLVIRVRHLTIVQNRFETPVVSERYTRVTCSRTPIVQFCLYKTTVMLSRISASYYCRNTQIHRKECESCKYSRKRMCVQDTRTYY